MGRPLAVLAVARLNAALLSGCATPYTQGDGRAVEHLTTFRTLVPAARTAELVDRALDLLREGQPTRQLREFSAASLQSSVEWQHEVGKASQALQDEELRRLARERTIQVVPRGCRC